MIAKGRQPSGPAEPNGQQHTHASQFMTWIVYILECADGSLYTGITNDLERRMRSHTSGKGAKYTKRRGPFTVRYTESVDSKGAALQREAAIKALNRSAKVALLTTPSVTGM
jgi:putative endonuclease